MKNDLIVAPNIYWALIIYQVCAYMYYLKSLWGNIIPLSIVQMKKLRSREFKKLAQNHTARKMQSWDLILDP